MKECKICHERFRTALGLQQHGLLIMMHEIAKERQERKDETL